MSPMTMNRNRSSCPPRRRRLLVVAFLATTWTSLSLSFATSSVSSQSSRRKSNAMQRVQGISSRLGYPAAADVALVRPANVPKGGAFKVPALLSAASDAGDGNSEDDAAVAAAAELKRKRVRKAVIISAAIALATWKRAVLLGAWRSLANSDLRSKLIDKLDALEGMGMTGLIIYTIFFALWEIIVGVTTPVETAAGMAFGVKRGIIANAIGKMGGAVLAFFIGRFLLFDYVSDKLKDNEMMGLVQESIKENPIRVALVWRFSFLPEQVKTFGLAVLPLRLRHFIAAVVLHGFPFTCLWTCMGAEAGALARGTITTPSDLFKVLVVGVYIFGFFISPTMVGLWVKSLKDQQKERTKKA